MWYLYFMSILITYSTSEQYDKILNLPYKDIHAINSCTLKGKREAWKLKSHWAAKEDPFILVTDKDNKPVKVFYSETGRDIINDLIEYLNGKNISTR